jgi:uncharacterized membrane protein YphA (DoxX/SURF4 family)
MATQALTESASITSPAQPWPLAHRVAFRFCFVYFGLLILSTQVINSIFTVPNVDVPDPATLWPVRLGIIWVAQHVFGVKSEIVYQGSGSGDKTFDWVLVFCILVVSIIATAVWSVLDRRRPGYPTLQRWFQLIIRVALISQLFSYGVDKAIPLQMSRPFLIQLVQPYGMKSPMGVLWSFVGSSFPYEICTGCAELLGGLLLIFPRTVTLGAIVCLFDMTQVFILNMTYDVCVKLFSFHLILMPLLLLAPQAGRLANFFLLNRPAEPLPATSLFQSRRGNRIAAGVLAFLCLWMLGADLFQARQRWYEHGYGRTLPALYGIWDIDEFTQDGQPRLPLLTDAGRYRRAIFEFADSMVFMGMDDKRVWYEYSTDAHTGALALAKLSDKKSKASFSVSRPSPDQLVLDGAMDGHKTTLKLHRLDLNSFLLLNRGFHWVEEYPFSR